MESGGVRPKTTKENKGDRKGNTSYPKSQKALGNQKYKSNPISKNKNVFKDQFEASTSQGNFNDNGFVPFVCNNSAQGLPSITWNPGLPSFHLPPLQPNFSRINKNSIKERLLNCPETSINCDVLFPLAPNLPIPQSSMNKLSEPQNESLLPSPTNGSLPELCSNFRCDSPSCFPGIPSANDCCSQFTRERTFSNVCSSNCCDGNRNRNVQHTIEEKNKEISCLKGAIRAYKYQLENNNPIDFFAQVISRERNARQKDVKTLGVLVDDFPLQLQEAFDKLKKATQARRIYHSFITEESALTRAFNSLLEDYGFHNNCDTLIQNGNDLKSLIKIGKKVSIQKIKFYQEQLHPLKLEQKLLFFESLKEQLHALFLKVSKSKKHFPDSDIENSEVPVYARIGMEYFEWKEEYLNVAGQSQEMVDQIASDFEKYSDYLKNIVEDKEVPTPNISPINSEALNSLIEKELKLTQKVSLIPLCCHSALNELKLRSSKLNTIQECLCEIKSLDSNFICVGAVDDLLQDEATPKEGTLSLLDYISQSKSTNGRAKRLFIEDVFKGLCDIHSKNDCYFFLTPKNILIVEGSAVLCPDKVTIYDPVPPFTFLAPECDLDSKTRKEKFLHVGPAADFYSLGRLILWLACVEFEGDFIECMTLLPQENPLLSKLLSRDPDERPSAQEISRDLEEMLSKIFGFDQEPVSDLLANLSVQHPSAEELNNEEAKTELDGSFASAQISPYKVEEDYSELIAQEEELIMKEMMDSSDEDNK